MVATAQPALAAHHSSVRARSVPERSLCVEEPLIEGDEGYAEYHKYHFNGRDRKKWRHD